MRGSSVVVFHSFATYILPHAMYTRHAPMYILEFYPFASDDSEVCTAWPFRQVVVFEDRKQIFLLNKCSFLFFKSGQIKCQRI